ncbi:MAG: NAD-dependent epimerase/dehydratase family protein, partial [Candidatus Omnitrophica bacterium]|nr:NAD-dependent epimerase/dehydratase family protein [Candidatus Omnitrophota bacterium]
MKILITGGSGFLGINLVRYLIANGNYETTVLDIADFDYAEKKNIHFVKGDIRDKALVVRLTEGAGIVIHAAAALPLYNEKEIYSTDVEGTKNLLEAALKNNIDRFIYISTTAVYGIPDHHPLYESDRLIGVGPYGKAKVIAEEICEEYRKKGMCIAILRPKSFIGPERLGVFALLYEWASDGKNFPIPGN